VIVTIQTPTFHVLYCVTLKRATKLASVSSPAPTSHRLNVVVRSPSLYREVGRNGETTTPRGLIIRSPPIVWITKFALSISASIRQQDFPIRLY